MKVTWNRMAVLSVIAVVSMLVLSCASGPRPPQPGTPAFYWGAANEMFRVGDYLKTNDNLSQITRSDNEFTARAQPFELVVSAGLARGFNDLADNFETGARMNRANPTPFRKQVNIFRGFGSNATLQFVEAFHRFQQTHKDAKTVALPFSYPTGSSSMPSQMSRVSKGIFVPDAEREDIQKDVLRRGVLLSAVRTVGAEEDAAKALEIFQKGNVEVPAPVFYLAMAQTLWDLSPLYSSTKLDQPLRMRLLCNEAQEALKLTTPSKQTKELSTKIEKALKKLGTT